LGRTTLSGMCSLEDHAAYTDRVWNLVKHFGNLLLSSLLPR